MNVALYVIVSTDKQEVLNQLVELKEYCKKNNYTIFGESFCSQLSQRFF